jgi:hypothetical protein
MFSLLVFLVASISMGAWVESELLVFGNGDMIDL